MLSPGKMEVPHKTAKQLNSICSVHGFLCLPSAVQKCGHPCGNVEAERTPLFQDRVCEGDMWPGKVFHLVKCIKYNLWDELKLVWQQLSDEGS